ncbi:Store-operated calcium entry-associated regulatory factor [Mortierella sp. AM989]|nr:Store-operated calcium entry-associated regulatory factor [Mortierella sp. AM989]
MKQGPKHRWHSLGLAALFIVIAVFWSPSVDAFGSNNKKVLLKDVQTLTLHRGRMTTGQRTSPVPQVSCVGGNACGDYEPGYNYPDDPFVLKGSCGLEYKLYYTKIHHNQDRYWKQPNIKQWAAQGFVLYSFLRNCLQHQADGRGDPPPPYRASGGRHDGGGGGGGGPGGGWGSGWGSGWGNNNSYRDKPTDGEGFRPGFWSGLGLGGLATYLATNRSRQEYNGTRPVYSSGTTWGSSYSQPSTSYGSYSGGWGAGPSSSSQASSSRPTRTTTGFGGTRRR